MNMAQDTIIKALEEDLVKTPAEVNVAEFSVVATKKRRRRKSRKRKKKKVAIENPEGGNIFQLQDPPLDAEMAMAPLRTYVDSTAMALALKVDEAANQQKKVAIENPEGGNICQLQDAPLDVEMARVPLRTYEDSTAMALALKVDEVANQRKKAAIVIPEGRNICHLQNAPLDAEMAMVPLRTYVDSTAMSLALKVNEVANQRKKKKRKKKKKGAIENPEGGNVCQLQDTPLDVDPTAIVANQQLLLAVPFQLLPEKVRIAFPRRKLLILDLNGLLADIVLPSPRDRKSDINIYGRGVFKRPFYYDFLQFCFERFEVAVWSSRSKKIVGRVVDYLFGGLKHKLLFCWDMFHCTKTRFKTLENRHKPLVFKELRKLWEKHYDNLPWERGDYNESNTLLLDDSPYKALLNPMNTSLFPFTFSYKDTGDKSLGAGGDLRVYLEELAKAENVQTYIQQHPFGQCAINEKSSVWSFYSTVLSTEPNQG